MIICLFTEFGHSEGKIFSFWSWYTCFAVLCLNAMNLCKMFLHLAFQPHQYMYQYIILFFTRWFYFSIMISCIKTLIGWGLTPLKASFQCNFCGTLQCNFCRNCKLAAICLWFGCDICIWFSTSRCQIASHSLNLSDIAATNHAKIVLKLPLLYSCKFRGELKDDESCIKKCNKNCTKNCMCKLALNLQPDNWLIYLWSSSSHIGIIIIFYGGVGSNT